MFYTVIIIAGLWNNANEMTIIIRMKIFARETTPRSNVILNFIMKLIKLVKMKKKTDVLDLVILYRVGGPTFMHFSKLFFDFSVFDTLISTIDLDHIIYLL